MMNFDVNAPRVIFGAGCSKTIPDVVNTINGIKTVMVVTDNGIKSLGIADPIEDALKKAGYNVVEYYDIAQDPTDKTVEEAALIAKSQNIDLFVAVGGGAVLDFTKAMALIMTNEAPLLDYSVFVGQKPVINDCMPWIGVPTTSGTGSEATHMALITGAEHDNRKLMVGNRSKMLATAAFLDPELVLGLPKSLTASTGMDVLSHAIEAYFSIFSMAANTYSDMWALKAIQLAGANLRKAVEDGQNVEVRANMMLAATFAGVSFGNSILQIGHAISHGIGETSHVPHGIACAWGLPYCIRRSGAANEEYKVVRVANALGLETKGKTKDELVIDLEDEIMKLNRDFNIPTPKSYGIGSKEAMEAGFNASVAYEQWMLQSGCVSVTNEELHSYYEELWAW